MAVPPTIPTSFVPHSASADSRRSSGDFLGAFGFIAYLIFGVAIVSALGMFGYSYLLGAEQKAKDAQLAQAESGLDPQTIAHFVRLRDRLVSSKQLLDSHIALSNFYTLFDSLLPKTVRFSQLTLTTQTDGTYILTGVGTAASFNSLASASDAFSGSNEIKSAIFSNISAGQGGLVSFNLTATVDPSLVKFMGGATATSGTGATASTTTP